MNWLRKIFTKWYIKRGYTFGYQWNHKYSITFELEPYWDCPKWVRPLLIFFSPSVYMSEYGKLL